MNRILLGCQTYTWQMSGSKYLNNLNHIMGIASQAGYAGIEPEVQFLGELSDPAKMTKVLKTHSIELAAVCLVEDWTNKEETEQERANADLLIKFLKHFPDTLLALCQMPGANRDNLEKRQKNLLNCVNTLAQHAADEGIKSGYHPNSPQGSIFRTTEDYEILLNGLDSSVLGWIPDVGHIANGGMDPLEKMDEYRQLICHVHYKDMFLGGLWSSMGEGSIDFVAITQMLQDIGFNGWIIVEDECEAAVSDPDGITLRDGIYIKEKLAPIVKTNF